MLLNVLERRALLTRGKVMRWGGPMEARRQPEVASWAGKIGALAHAKGLAWGAKGTQCSSR